MKAGDMVVVRIIITVRETNARIVLWIIRVLSNNEDRPQRSYGNRPQYRPYGNRNEEGGEQRSYRPRFNMEDRMKEGSVLNVLRIILALIIMKEMNSVLSVLALIMDSRGKAASATTSRYNNGGQGGYNRVQGGGFLNVLPI